MRSELKAEWPGNKQIAVVWSVSFELWLGSVANILGAGRYPAPPPREGARDQGSLAYGEYGGRVGIWRLMEIFDKYGLKMTVNVNGYVAEKFPEAVRELKKRGDDIVAHGYTNSVLMDRLDPQQEEENILKTIEALKNVTGERPIGWLSPAYRPGENTLKIIAREGFLWQSDFCNDDLPYTINVDGKKMVMIPYMRDINDIEMFARNVQPPSAYVEAFKSVFDTLYEEGSRFPKMMNASLHPHLYGRPFGRKPIEECIRYAKSFPEVWFTTRTEIAKWWLQKGYP